MTDNSIITSIAANGGWCQLHHTNRVALINVVGGRLLFYNEELSFIEKFDLQTGTLDGYFVILNKTKQRLERANWIRKILTVGGKIIRDSKLPGTLHSDTLPELLLNLKSSREIFILRTIGGELTGRILDFSDSGLTLEILSINKISEEIKIDFTEIVCFELRVQKLKQVVRHERRFT